MCARVQGITLRQNEHGRCALARIFHGSFIHKLGVLHVGDEIREINGLPVYSKPAEHVQMLLVRPAHLLMRVPVELHLFIFPEI